jgi:hypothetical protein
MAVHETFEMPAIEEGAACFGFWPRLLRGWNDLLVYATRIAPHDDYSTSICTRTALASETIDFKQLGPGRKPKPQLSALICGQPFIFCNRSF